MPLKICPVLKPDADAVNRITFAAFAGNPVSGLLQPVPTSEAIISNMLESVLKKWGQDSTERRMQVKDTETGQTISHAVWRFIKQGDDEDQPKKREQAWPKDSSVESATNLMEAHLEAYEKAMGKKPYILLDTLATSPDHQRRGAGTLLLQWGVDRARALSLPIFLSVSPSSLPMFSEFRFQPCGAVEVDGSSLLPPHNQPSALRNIRMLLPAPSPDCPPSPTYSSSNEPRFPIQVHLVTDHADFPALEDIRTRAFAHNEYIALALPKSADPAAEAAYNVRSAIINQTADPSNIYHKAVDPLSGLIVGYSHWHFYDDLTRKHKLFAAPLPPNANVPLLNATFAVTSRMREDFFADPPRHFAYCSTLAVDPEWHRRGVGKTLLEEVLKEVDRQGWEAWLEASKEGQGLYEKLGWKEIMALDADLTPWGGAKVERIVCMLRKPKAREEKSI